MRSVMTELRFENVRVNYSTAAGTHCVLRNLDLLIGAGEFVCLLGKTGCGKSTLLKIVLGEIQPSAGSVSVAGKVVRGPGKHCGYVPQQYSLFPDRRVRGNIAFGPRTADLHFWSGLTPAGRRKAREIELLTDFLLRRIGLSVKDADKFPFELSGGMQQRVAIAQALATDPELLLMDEAFSALDSGTRLSMQELIREIWRERQTTVLFVTHNTAEALALASRIVVLAKPHDNANEPASVALDMASPWNPEMPIVERRQTREFNEMVDLLENATSGAAPILQYSVLE